ncbi:MAG TPA: hypothetical protein VK928_10220 [Longimicrobiales bacterium]|nr:hypothetical protein [Longimicrobiales bacterium]
MAVLIGSYLLLVFVLPVALSGVVSYRALPVGRRCAQCGGDTIQLASRRWRTVSALMPGGSLQRRWCLCCGWEGTARVPSEARRRTHWHGRMTARPVPAAVLRRATQTLDVRSVTVDGKPFRVMLQCWTGTSGFYGRLVFVGRSGRLWMDAVEAFTGSSEHEVLGQALSLPEGLLQNRLRRLVSRP